MADKPLPVRGVAPNGQKLPDGYQPAPIPGAQRISKSLIGPKQIAAAEAFVLDGTIDTTGRIIAANRRNELVYGGINDASPEYFRFLDEVNEWAARYPTSDPRTWVPLAQAGIKADGALATDAMMADQERMSKEGANGKTKDQKRDKNDPVPEPDDGPGLWGQLGGAIFGGGISGAVTSGGYSDLNDLVQPATDAINMGREDIGDAYQAVDDLVAPATDEISDRTEPLRDATNFAWRNTAAHTINQFGDDFKAAVKGITTAAQMPQQGYAVSAPASILGDLKDGDYKSALLHMIGQSPGSEAVMIGLENLFDSEFYREGGKEQTVWGQTTGGQVILDQFGQGGEEQTGGADDKPGVQMDTGEGFVASKDMLDAAEQARLRANTLVPEQEITKEELKYVDKIRRMKSPEDSMKWLAEHGFAWSEEANTFVHPAQGWTIGRAASINLYDPYTAEYNATSGMLDGLTNLILDPLMYIPGGSIKAGVSTLRGGGKIVGGPGLADSIKALVGKGPTLSQMKTGLFRSAYIDTMDTDDVIKAVKQGADAAHLQSTGGRVVMRVDGQEMASAQEAVEAITTGAYTKHPNTTFALEHRGYLETFPAKKVHEISDKDMPFAVAQDADGRVMATGREAVDMATGMSDEGGAIADPVTSVNAFYDKGYSISVQRGGKYPIMTPDQVGKAIEDDYQFVSKAARTGGAMATNTVWNWLVSGKGQYFVNGLLEETDALRIWNLTNKKLHPYVAHALAEAKTKDEVLDVVAPLIGAEIRNKNDLANFAVNLPRWDVGTKLFKATSMDRLKDVWVRRVAGQEFLPAPYVRTENAMEVLEATQRMGRVAITNVDARPEWQQAVNRLMGIDPRPGHAHQAAVYQATYGRAGDEIIVNEHGRVIASSTELKKLREETQADLFGTNARFLDNVENDTIDRAILESIPHPGAAIAREGNDGTVTVLGKLLMKELNLPENLVNKITKAFGEDSEMIRLYVQDGKGGADLPPWADGHAAVPTLEADVLGNHMPLPNIHDIRAHASHWGRILRNESVDAEQAAKAVDDLLSDVMVQWKRFVLLGAGVRFPTYAMRATLDTQMSIMLSGGASPLNRPRDLLGVLLTSSINKAVQSGKAAEGFRLSVKNAMAESPIMGALFRDTLTTDAAGKKWEEGMIRFLNGDGDAADDWVAALNMGYSTSRGSAGQDLIYARVAREMEEVNLSDAVNDTKVWGKYTMGLTTEINRYAKSATTKRLANANYSMEENIKWFMESTNEGKAVISQFGPRAEAQFATPQGVEEYLRWANDNMRRMVGNDEDLLAVIARGGDLGDGHTLWTPGINRKPSHQIKQLISDAARKEGATLPETVVVRRQATKLGDKSFDKQSWDEFNNWLFMHAGRWEDTYGREPFFRDRYYQHVEDLGTMLNPAERIKLADRLAEEGSPRLAKKLRKLTHDGPLTRGDVDRIAKQRTVRDMSDIAYDAANRREWAYAARILSPFVQAAVNGMYRWTKAAVQNPEMTYRVAKVGQFLTDSDSAFINEWLGTSAPDGNAFIFEDPVTGERRIGVPLLGSLMEALALPDEMSALFSISAGGMNLAAPGLERAMLNADLRGEEMGVGVVAKGLFPGVGPVASISAAMLADGSEDWVADYLLPYGVPGDAGSDIIIDQFAPRAITRLIDAIHPSQEQLDRKGSRVLAIYAMVVREEGGLQNMTKREQKEAMDRAVNLSRNLSLVEAFANIGAPGAVSVDTLYKDVGDVPDHVIYTQQVGEMYRNYLKASNGDFDQAEAEFVADVGLETLMLTAASGDNSEVAPPTLGARALFDNYEEGYDKYEPVLKYLLSVRDGTEFDIRLYSQQISSGERQVVDPARRVEAANEMILNYIYENRQQKIIDKNMGEYGTNMAVNQLKDELVRKGWTGNILIKPTQRDKYATLMMQAATDPNMRPFIGDGKRTPDLLANYLRNRRAATNSLEARGVFGNLSDLTTTAETERMRLFALGSVYADRNPGFATIWFKTLRDEVMEDETALEEAS